MSRKWTEEEIKVLEEEYPKRTARCLAKKLDRTKYSIYLKASELGLKSERNWYAREIEYLEKTYGIKPLSSIAKKLDRTEKSVKEKIQSLDLEPNDFGEEEKKKIKKLHGEGEGAKSIARKMNLTLDLVMEVLCPDEELERLYTEEGLLQREIAEKFGVTQSYISKRMKKLGIESNSNEPWTPEEEKTLKESYPTSSKEELLSIFSNRTWSSIKSKALKLGVARPKEEYRNSEEVKEKLRSLAEENKLEVDFDKDLCLSYILGVIDGDGFHDRKGTIGLEVKSSEFADKFYEALMTVGLKPGRGTRSNRERETVWASSVQLVEWVMSLDYEKKFNWLTEERERAWKYIEGRYESDGNLEVSNTARICSYDDEAKKFLSKLLSSLGIECSIQQNNVHVFKSSADDFYNKIDPVIRNRPKMIA